MATISAAIVSCSSTSAGSVVAVNAGTYNNTTSLNLYGKNVTLRCPGGPTQCTINDANGTLFMGRQNKVGNATVTADTAAGATSFHVNSVSGTIPAANTIIALYQCDPGNSTVNCNTGAPTDNGTIWVCGFTLNCNIDGGAGIWRDQQQTLLITSTVNNGGGDWTINFTPALYLSLTAAQTPMIEWNDQASFPCVGLGLEGFTIYTPAAGGTANMQYCYASWITGNRFVGSNTAGGNSVIEVTGNKSSLIANNYIDSLDPASPNYSSYMFIEPLRGSDILYLNNIFVRTAFRGLGKNMGEVIAYNFFRDSVTPAIGFQEDCIFQHEPESAFTLMEGNQLGCIRDDDTWGTHHFDTFFRNNTAGYDVPFLDPSGTKFCFQIGSFARFENAIGNTCGSKVNGSNYAPSGYQSIGNGANAFIINDGANDALTNSSFMRWGNVTIITQGTDTPANSGVRFVSSEVPSSLSAPNVAYSNSVPGNNNLPPSFFMSTTAHPSGGTGLSWWRVCKTWSSFPSSCTSTQTQPFPAIGPDVTGGIYVNGFAYDIPAEIAWLALPTDTSFQNSYTVTGSSWSSGTETLTVTIPGGVHIQGGFTPPAWNSACNPVAGVLSFTGRSDNEILMTASTSTTISYALASNPGLTCSGTIGWPDVRQYDASVYQTDASSSPSVDMNATGVTWKGLTVSQ